MKHYLGGSISPPVTMFLTSINVMLLLSRPHHQGGPHRKQHLVSIPMQRNDVVDKLHAGLNCHNKSSEFCRSVCNTTTATFYEAICIQFFFWNCKHMLMQYLLYFWVHTAVTQYSIFIILIYSEYNFSINTGFHDDSNSCCVFSTFHEICR